MDFDMLDIDCLEPPGLMVVANSCLAVHWGIDLEFEQRYFDCYIRVVEIGIDVGLMGCIVGWLGSRGLG